MRYDPDPRSGSVSKLPAVAPIATGATAGAVRLKRPGVKYVQLKHVMMTD